MNVNSFNEAYGSKIRKDFGLNDVFASSAEIDVFATRNNAYLCIECKTRMYARIRLETEDYQIPYSYLHSRYHFDRYPDAVNSLLELRKNPALADDAHETVKSSCELLRYCLGLIQGGYTSRNCSIVVLMPFYAKKAEFETVTDCLDRLRKYVREEHSFDFPMAVWKVNTDSLDNEVPHNIWIETSYEQKGFSIEPPPITFQEIQKSLTYWRSYRYWKKCESCKYRKQCELILFSVLDRK